MKGKSSDMMYIFQNIRVELKTRKWSVDRYCKKLGIRRNTFYNWEMKNNLPASYLIRTAELFGLTVDELIHRREETPNEQT